MTANEQTAKGIIDKIKLIGLDEKAERILFIVREESVTEDWEGAYMELSLGYDEVAFWYFTNELVNLILVFYVPD